MVKKALVPFVSTTSKSSEERVCLAVQLQDVLRDTSANISEKVLADAIAVDDFLLLHVVSLRIELSDSSVITEQEFRNWVSRCSDGCMQLVQVRVRA